MFDWIFSVMQQMFQLFFDFMNSIQLRENVSLWSLLLVFLIGGGISSAVIQHIGGASLASAGVGVYDDYKSAALTAERDAARDAQQRERESYEYYEKNRYRNWQYDKKFRDKYGIKSDKKGD